ncbi:MAG TPA: FecR domain-containing protein [Flavitalea sp.]|nr:FecR domain-containing protein [Flavitalea sp.]
MPEAFHDYDHLIFLYLKQELTDEQERALNAWRAASEKNNELFEALTNENSLRKKLQSLHEIEGIKESSRALLLKRLFPEAQSEQVKRKRISRRSLATAAAVVSIFLFAGIWIASLNRQNKETPIVLSEGQQPNTDLLPGAKKAVLILADGREMILDENEHERLVEKDGSEVINANGILSYGTSPRKSKEAIYHLLQVPKKGEYDLTLSDGTRVKLNSESSIYYPTVFDGKERRINITGEAYFEVAKDAGKPFIVSVNGVEVKVLGTHFNVNAFANEEKIKISLAEGSVQVTTGSGNAVIKPGEQASVAANGKLEINPNADLDAALAWTSGYFIFRDADIVAIMQQVQRWYDVDVHYQDAIMQRFVARIPRSVTAADFFRILEATGWVHFKIEGRQITVLK